MKKLLNEKYRPDSLETYIFKDEKLKKAVEKWLTDGSFPHVLFSGSPGTGKSSLGRLLLKLFNIAPSDIMVINTSLRSGIDVVRHEIEPWLTRRGFSPFKVVLMEEFERVSPDAQKALKAVIEDNSDIVRFIATSNNISSIDPANISRFQHFVLDSLNEEEVLDLVVRIVEEEDLSILDDDPNVLLSHVDTYSPDLRKIINSIDKETLDGVIHPCNPDSTSGGLDEWQRVWESGDAANQVPHLLSLTETIDMNNYEWFYRVVYDNVSKNFEEPGEVVITVSNYLDKATRAANQRIHMDAFIYSCFLLDD